MTGHSRRVGILPLLMLLAAALALRLLLMPLPEPFPADLSTFWRPWMAHAATFGLSDLYLQGQPPVNYPPLVLVLLGGLGKIYGLFVPDMGDTAWQRVLIKLPAVVADLGVMLLLYRVTARRQQAQVGPAAGNWAGNDWEPLVVAALWGLNPAVIYVSAYWGQVDSIHTLWMVAALLAALAGNWGIVGLLMGLGLLTKLQSIVLLPLLLLLAWRAGVASLLRGGLALIATLVLGLLPLAAGGALDAVLQVYRGSVGFYRQLTLNAYNLWWPVYFLGERLLGRQLTDDLGIVGPYTARHLGLSLLAAYVIFILWALHRGLNKPSSQDRTLAAQASVANHAQSIPPKSPVPTFNPASALVSVSTSNSSLIFFAAALLALGFFMLPTEIHERYALPVLAFLAPLAWRQRAMRWAYWLLSGSIFINLVEVLPFARWIYQLLTTLPGERLLLAAVNLLLFAWLTARFWKACGAQEPRPVHH